MRLSSSCRSLKAGALLLAGAWAAPAAAAETSAAMAVGATVVGSMESSEASSEGGAPVLVVSSTSEPIVTADEGVEVREVDGSWSATAVGEGSDPLYLTLTY